MPPTPLGSLETTAGTRTATFCTVRPVGMASSTSESNTSCCRTCWRSTIGVSPVTVTVSSTLPTDSSASTVAANDPASSTPSRTTVLNPGSVNVTE